MLGAASLSLVCQTWAVPVLARDCKLARHPLSRSDGPCARWGGQGCPSSSAPCRQRTRQIVKAGTPVRADRYTGPRFVVRRSRQICSSIRVGALRRPAARATAVCQPATTSLGDRASRQPSSSGRPRPALPRGHPMDQHRLPRGSQTCIKRATLSLLCS